MESLVRWDVIIIQLVWKQQAEIFVSPCRIAHVRSQFVHLLLELVVVVVTSVVRQLFEEIHALKQLRSVLACDLNRIIN